MFGWKHWDKTILHFKGRDIKILEIGVYKGDAMEKFAEVFLERNKNAEYYGIDTWEGSPEYVEIDFKDVEKSANAKRDKSPVKDRIHFIKKESSLALPELVGKKMMFDIIFIDASHTSKDVLYDGVLSIKLLKKQGIIIFDDYLWSKLEPNIFTPKPAIDAILNIHSDELEILYSGYQVIVKKTELKFKPKVKDETIIYELNESLNYYWKNTEMKEILTLFNLKDIPEINIKTEKITNIKFRHIENINLFSKLNINELMYKYYILKDIKEEIQIRLKNPSMYQDTKLNLNVLNTLSSLGKYGLYGLVYDKYIDFNNCESAIKIFPTDNIKNQSDELNMFTPHYIINDNNELFKNSNINKLIDELQKEPKKYNCITGFHMIERGNYRQMYNIILMQILLLRYKLNINGDFQIDISDRYEFVNDLIALLNYLFKKVIIYIHSNKISRLNIFIICKEYIGITTNLYNNIVNALEENKDVEIISLFDIKTNYIDVEALENTIFNFSKKIIKIVENNNKVVADNKNKFINNILKRTIDDVYNYTIELSRVKRSIIDNNIITLSKIKRVSKPFI